MNQPFATLTLLAVAATAFGQGDLLPPPGPPGPTMKTLDQVEARIIVNATNTPGDAGNTYIISLPGSYYLTSNLAGDSGKHGISIQASDVTLDLNGFALFNLNADIGTVRGIDVPAEQKNLCVRNGTVRGWNDGGVRAENARSSLVEKLRVSNNTNTNTYNSIGIFAGLGSVIKECIANANNIGIRTVDRCQVINCISTENSVYGFLSTSHGSFMDCTSSRNGRQGFKVELNTSLLRCGATRNEHHGIEAGDGCTITECTAGSNVASGVFVTHSIVTNCSANYNAIGGIDAFRSTIAFAVASFNGHYGLFADEGNISNSNASSNGLSGIRVAVGNVTSCRAESNGRHGIETSQGSVVTNSVGSYNVLSGIVASEGSITNCVAQKNGNHGIDATDAVVAFCNARMNNRNNNGSEDLHIPGASHRTGNVPSP